MGDIDLNDPEVEHAANKIQAGFKGMKARKEVATIKEKKKAERDNKEIIDGKNNEKLNENEEATKDKDEIDENKDEIDIDLNDPDVEVAATKIQAGFKGMKTR